MTIGQYLNDNYSGAFGFATPAGLDVATLANDFDLLDAPNSAFNEWTDSELMAVLRHILDKVNEAEDAENEAKAVGERLSSVAVQEGTAIQSDATGLYRTVTYTVRFRQPVDLSRVGPVLS